MWDHSTAAASTKTKPSRSTFYTMGIATTVLISGRRLPNCHRLRKSQHGQRQEGENTKQSFYANSRKIARKLTSESLIVAKSLFHSLTMNVLGQQLALLTIDQSQNVTGSSSH
jgi:hypothetical protein